MTNNVTQPIFFIGMGRSGTTIMFEAFARHPDLAWPSSYCRMYPDHLWLNGLRRLLDNRLVKLYSYKQQYGKKRKLNDYFPQPDEAYPFWNKYAGSKFARDCLHNQACLESGIGRTREAVYRVLQWQGKLRFAAKFTGPPRITYLKSIFPDAIFVNVIRDGRAVVHSLLNVKFWKEKGGLTGPFWDGCLRDEDLAMWHESGKDPGVLAALEWRRVVDITKEEAQVLVSGEYHEVRYEEFMSKPHEVLTRLCMSTGLQDASEIHAFVDRGAPLKDMNDKYRRDYSPEYIALLEKHMQPSLGTIGYRVAG